ncbi:MAG: glutathione S-transferase family protein [Hyphomicrobiales bacterium]|nr:glutathione S-transferase family protein [Hyphomicrobiales bacterium]
MKLYSLPLSPYAARVRGAIYAKGLAIEIAAPPADWRTSPEYRAINPLVRVPVLLLDDGTVIAESAVIVEYLEDAHPQVPLRPDTAEALARVRLITQVADLYVMQPMMPLFYMFDGKEKDEALIASQLAKLEEGLTHLDAMLLKGEYAFPGQLTTADVWLTPVRFSLEGLMGFAKLPRLLDDHEAVAAYAETAKKDAALGRVWDEMTEGLEAMLAARAAQAV